MKKYQTVRGTRDLFFEEVEKFQEIERVVNLIAKKYNIKEIRTPIFEFKGVFEKNVGESTDIVNKEMYVFEDRKGEELALRPEGTAPVIRAIISNGLSHLLPLKFFYIAPMFRYERPQKGRQRQFHQFGFEYVGTDSYASDIEIINVAVDILKNLNISDYKLLINSLGSKETLEKYKDALRKYLSNFKEDLSMYSQERLKTNPLRILDSKEEQDKKLIKDAPKLSSYLNDEDKRYFEKVLKAIEILNIPYEIDDKLVRGLDYYSHSVFEFVTDSLGSQGTLIGGGRYNSMMKEMGGVDKGCFGFGAGLERIAMMIDTPKVDPYHIAIISQKEQYDLQALFLVDKIRNKGDFAASFILGKDITSKLKKLDKDEYFLAIIMGEEEDKKGILSIKDLSDFKQISIAKDDIISFLSENYGKYKLK